MTAFALRFLMFFLVAFSAGAQTYPSKPIRC